jgi:hypothetical protein
VAVKNCVVPTAIEALGGVIVIEANGADVTVNVTALLVMVPAELLTTTENCAPLSDEVVAGVA